ncbi:MAG: diguanylate cyclase domain-containing protein [Bacillota bacterium]
MIKIFKKIKYLIIIILFLIIVFISFTNYQSIKQAIKDKYNKQNELVENSILQEISHINDAYKIAEDQLNKEMKEYSLLLKDKYRRNSNIESWDLKEMKEDFGDYDIYIIDSSLQVVRTTFPADKGLDFSQYPGFSKLLTKRLQGDSFAVDRLNLSTQTGRIKKYSYIPTHDNQYLLELGIDIKKKYPVLQNLDIYADAADITEQYKTIEQILFYKFNPGSGRAAELRNTKKPYINSDISDEEQEFVKEAFTSKQAQTDNSSDQNRSSRYIPALMQEESNDGWWNSFVVKIKYNNQVMIDEIKAQRNLFLTNVLIMVGVFVTFIGIVIYLLNKFSYMAYHDQLTGLAKREFFAEKVDELLKVAKKRDQKLAILFLDIDNFKEINDNYGHNIGDIVLQKTASRLQENLPQNYIISRLGGDEFTIAITDISSKNEIVLEMDKVTECFKEPLVIEGSQLFISVSIGVSIYPDDASDLESLIKQGDDAMYKAKKQQQSYLFYN